MASFRPSYFMLVPTMACQASCKYCFAKKQGDVMSISTLEATIDFMERIAPSERGLHVVFHGGEPLLAGTAFYEQALPMLKERFGSRLNLSIQSNLWELIGQEGNRLTELLHLYKVSVGTSLDGYREMCNEQRGDGYYEKTTAAIEKLRKYGIVVSIICTFGKNNTDKACRVFEEAHGGYSIHGAVPSLFACGNDTMAVTPEEMTRIFIDSYEAYRAAPEHARVLSIDKLAKACFRGESTLCTFRHCLGQFASIAPNGSVFSCQRFIGCDGFSLGNVNNCLTEEVILRSPAYLRIKSKQDGMASACGDCPHVPYCNGGCLYNVFTNGGNKDPYCEAYKAVFERLKRDMALEMAGELRRKLTGEPLKNVQTPVLYMAGEKPHPYDERLRNTIVDK